MAVGAAFGPGHRSPRPCPSNWSTSDARRLALRARADEARTFYKNALEARPGKSTEARCGPRPSSARPCSASRSRIPRPPAPTWRPPGPPPIRPRRPARWPPTSPIQSAARSPGPVQRRGPRGIRHRRPPAPAGRPRHGQRRQPRRCPGHPPRTPSDRRPGRYGDLAEDTRRRLEIRGPQRHRGDRTPRGAAQPRTGRAIPDQRLGPVRPDRRRRSPGPRPGDHQHPDDRVRQPDGRGAVSASSLSGGPGRHRHHPRSPTSMPGSAPRPPGPFQPRSSYGAQRRRCSWPTPSGFYRPVDPVRPAQGIPGHADLGRRRPHFGALPRLARHRVPREEAAWQDPLRAADHPLRRRRVPLRPRREDQGDPGEAQRAGLDELPQRDPARRHQEVHRAVHPGREPPACPPGSRSTSIPKGSRTPTRRWPRQSR